MKRQIRQLHLNGYQTVFSRQGGHGFSILTKSCQNWSGAIHLRKSCRTKEGKGGVSVWKLLKRGGMERMGRRL